MIPAHKSDIPHRSEADQRGFFDTAMALAQTAAARAGPIGHDIVIAGSRIRFVFAGPALETLLMPAIAHRLAPDHGTPDLVIHVWDSASTGVAMCPPPVEQHCFSDRGDIWSFHSAAVRSAFHWSEFSLNLLDLDRAIGMFWVNSSVGLPYWTQASPFRTLFHWWMERRGAQLVHAAVVGTEAGGVLVTGKGGVGKSTTALACLAAGLAYVGDDYVLLTGGDTIMAHSLYRTAKVNVGDVARFAHFAPRLLGGNATAGEEKAIIFLDAGVVDALPVRIVVTPRFGSGNDTVTEPVAPAMLVGAATYTTLAQLPHAGQQTVDFIAGTLDRLPGACLALGRDPAKVVAAVRSLTETPAGRHPAAPHPASGTPLVSVIIPAYQAAHFVADAVGSVVAQGYPKLELIIVDDGSTDAIAEAVEALPIQARLLRQANSGPAAARNLGLRAASGQIIAFLDADDLWPPGKLAAALAWLQDNPETDVVMGHAQLLEQNDDGVFDFVGSPADSFPFYIGAGVYRRQAFARAGLFDPLLRFAEDVDWFASAKRCGLRIDSLDMVTLNVRRHRANSTRHKTGVELSPLQLARNSLLRKRAQTA